MLPLVNWSVLRVNQIAYSPSGMKMEDEIIRATTRLLGAVGTGDFDVYSELSDATLTCIEPETQGIILDDHGRTNSHFL